MFDWNEFLQLAKSIATNSSEAFQRTAISRSYYSAYHHASIFVTQLGSKLPKGGEAHQAVQDELVNYAKSKNNTDYNIASTNLSRLRSKRNRADYYDSPPIKIAEVTLAISLAENIKDKCK